MTTSSEDISQGAGQASHILQELKDTFYYNPRLGELYTWPFINTFDYQFSFGIDTFFRVFDVVLVASFLTAIFVVATGRLPKLTLKDSLLFNAGFLLLILAPLQYSEVLYARFSFIHNYLITGLFFTLLLIPFSLEIRSIQLPKKRLFFLASFILGFLFSMSSQVAPVVFIGISLLILLLSPKENDLRSKYKQLLTNWKLYIIVGIVSALFVTYIIGPGIASHYANDPALRYIPISGLLNSPSSIAGLATNLLANSILLLPYALMVLVCSITLLKSNLVKNTGKSKWVSKKYILYCSLFFILFLGATSQIYLASLLRVTFPMYISVIILVVFTLDKITLSIKERLVIQGILLILLLNVLIVADMLLNQLSYNQQLRPILDDIKNSPTHTVCVKKETIKTPTSILGFKQTPLLEEWMLPVNIFNKSVTFCD